jgi:Ion transport protein
MFRLFRMMRVEGRYDTALTMFDDVFYNQKDILGTALFVGVTTWLTVASLYYQAERRSNDMIYCGRAPSYCGDPDEIDVSLCEIDQWGIVDCSPAGCPPSEENPEPCYNLYRSIPMASYFTLLNLFGEFPLIDQHCVAGKIVATLTAIVAVAIFALPASIIGNGLEDIIYLRRKERLLATNALTIAVEPSAVESPVDDSVNVESRKLESVVTVGFEAPTTTRRGRWYNFLLAHASYGSTTFDMTINFLVVGTALTFMLDTVSTMPPEIRIAMDVFEFTAVVIFTLEYAARWWVCKEDPKYAGKAGRLLWMTSFLPMIDLLTVVPYWIDVCMKGQIFTPNGDNSSFSVLVKSLRLLRILRFERYTQAFTTFDDVISENGDILAVTGFSAIIVWIFLSAILYFTERDNPDDEMAQNYKSVPDSMWMTLLNLSGESPLAQYSIWGKIITGFLGLLATGLFGIPIGVLGAGFESVVARSAVDTPDEDEDEGENNNPDSDIEQMCYNFVNGLGSRLAKWFEIFIYILIMLSVAVGIWQTVDGHESSFASVEWFSVIVFTLEYLIRLVGVPSDPQFDGKGNWFICRVRFIFSFYSLVDLLAILPFYLAVAFPGSWVDNYDEMFRMLRLLRLIKLDKYFPSITLIDDVIRLKWNALRIAGFAALSLWIIFAGLLYLTENKDTFNEIDDVPLYGCYSDCTMSDR